MLQVLPGNAPLPLLLSLPRPLARMYCFRFEFRDPWPLALAPELSLCLYPCISLCLWHKRLVSASPSRLVLSFSRSPFLRLVRASGLCLEPRALCYVHAARRPDITLDLPGQLPQNPVAPPPSFPLIHCSEMRCR